MKVSPAAGPGVASLPNTAPTASQQTARSKAISMIAQPQQTHPVQNPSNVSPEEMSAIRPPNAGITTEDTTANQQQAAETSEQTAVKSPVSPKEDPQLSSQYALLARKEKALRAKVQQQEQSIKAKETALAAREAAIAEKDKQYAQGYLEKSALKNNPLKAFADAGLSYDDVTQALLNQGQVDPRVEAYIQKLETKLSQFEEKFSTAEKQAQSQQQQAYDAALTQIKADATSLVKSNPEQYEAVLHTKSVNDIVDLIKRTYDEDGVLMTVEEAADEVESYLIEEAGKLSQLSKIQKMRMQASAKTASTQSAQPSTNQTPQQQTMKTLTNAASTNRKLSAKERAVLAFRGELKS